MTVIQLIEYASYLLNTIYFGFLRAKFRKNVCLTSEFFPNGDNDGYLNVLSRRLRDNGRNDIICGDETRYVL